MVWRSGLHSENRRCHSVKLFDSLSRDTGSLFKYVDLMTLSNYGRGIIELNEELRQPQTCTNNTNIQEFKNV